MRPQWPEAQKGPSLGNRSFTFQIKDQNFKGDFEKRAWKVKPWSKVVIIYLATGKQDTVGDW